MIEKTHGDDEDVQTLGGLAMAALGRVPLVGDRFGWRGYTFEVLHMDGRRVDKLLATPGSANDELEPGKQRD